MIHCLHKLGMALATPVSSGMAFSNDCKPSIADELRLNFIVVLQYLICGLIGISCHW